ncbi:PR domain zinc finger protein 4-like isoform X1 [Trichogramma pretiosum]|uniref:PR domain zinc finger protein 4-like isoform X1 n=1 Tax=Trichogramma pretiosum TaxID=7493 RepID=UPI0006C9DF4C|nr:PR domain zinc finger protein 4-like isoform X1 [Trichogramma pretiosum]
MNSTKVSLSSSSDQLYNQHNMRSTKSQQQQQQQPLHGQHHQRKSLERVLKCPNCPKLFSRQGYLRMHQVTHYPQNRLIECTRCDKKFCRPGHMALHLRSHHHHYYGGGDGANRKSNNNSVPAKISSKESSSSGGKNVAQRKATTAQQQQPPAEKQKTYDRKCYSGPKTTNDKPKPSGGCNKRKSSMPRKLVAYKEVAGDDNDDWQAYFGSSGCSYLDESLINNVLRKRQRQDEKPVERVYDISRF